MYKRIKAKGYARLITNFGNLNIELYCDKVYNIYIYVCGCIVLYMIETNFILIFLFNRYHKHVIILSF